MAASVHGLAFGQERALHVYRQTRVETASPGELVLMLYNEAIKDMKNAVALIGRKDIAGSGECLLKTEDIIDELRGSLNLSAGGDLARKLYSVYDYIYSRLVEANLKKASAPLEDAVKVMIELRTGWEEALGRHG